MQISDGKVASAGSLGPQLAGPHPEPVPDRARRNQHRPTPPGMLVHMGGQGNTEEREREGGREDGREKGRCRFAGVAHT
eukprot:2445834-Rhodomonas_salina.2